MELPVATYFASGKNMIALPKKKRVNHHVNPTASVLLTEQEVLSLLSVAQAHYERDPKRPWLIPAQTRAVKKLNACLGVIIEKKRRLNNE